MINQIFYNLPKEKKEEVKAAFITELQTLSYDNVPINRIINDTRIFYQYFDSIKDLNNKILKVYYDNENSRAISSINEHNDNILSIIFIALKLKYNIELELKVVETSIIPYK